MEMHAMRWLGKYFRNGVMAIVPIGIVVWAVVQLFNFFDGLLGSQLLTVDHHVIPGLGVLMTLALILVAGALATHWASRRFFVFLESQIERVPVIKSVYGVVKDTVAAFVGQRQGFQKVVLVPAPGFAAEVIGFVTQSDLASFGGLGAGKVTVFVPLSFQMTGMTLLVPAEQVKELDMTVEQGIRYTLSAGLARGSNAAAARDDSATLQDS
jgi:uncharacterized membrane protein